MSLATQSKLIKYSALQKELRLEGIRELEDLIIEGTNCNVMRGKLDQKSSHFEVDWAMGRDIRKVIAKPYMVRVRVIFADWRDKFCRCKGPIPYIFTPHFSLMYPK